MASAFIHLIIKLPTSSITFDSFRPRHHLAFQFPQPATRPYQTSMSTVASIVATASPPIIFRNPTQIMEPNTHSTKNGSQDAANMSEAVFAGLALLVALIALVVALLHLRHERNKRRQTYEVQVELAEL
ncbi:hypothetical protein P153DRAFT_398132 [Dothidotthia symphoricarpi CBS 119687]|uniref:Uncharacterized protein n=1 Tax=Dothidotthia symphoricarpi CBS 119687 TaxID=1392245 RepID=A0A6A6A9J4_9PLEO|nr:uncharacterized protein P153DRAFT_398132 [Dothidotthia symphoricarpi CBS 119687]KAF2127507.1 hypothetical protein P153DRAFT_398132 [Dothidotthia symphoricarpi CBS 119687]